MTKRQRTLALLLYRQLYYLANADQWSTVYLENSRRVLARTPRRIWTGQECRTLRRLYPHHATQWVADQLGRTTHSVNGQAWLMHLHKDPAYLQRAMAATSAKLHQSGQAHRFPKGHVPANKGLRRPGWSAGRMQETQFRKGESRNKMPLFSERLIFGYLYIKVAEVPRVPYMVNWLALHVLNWERANGRPVPAGHVLRFRDGNRTNVSAENLELVTKADNMLRNSVHNLPEAIVEVVQLRGALIRSINKRIRNEPRH